MSLISKLFKAAKPFIAAALPFTPLGPVAGGFAAKLLTASSSRSSLMAPANGLPTSLPGAGDGGMVDVVNPAAGGVVARGAIAMGRWLIGARGIARNAAGKIVGVMRGTQLFRNKRVIALAKQIGIQGAAVALGIAITDVAEMFVAESGKRRRTRGITGRDIKCTRRTLGKIRSVQRMIGITRTRSSGSRARSTGHTIVQN